MHSGESKPTNSSHILEFMWTSIEIAKLFLWVFFFARDVSVRSTSGKQQGLASSSTLSDWWIRDCQCP